jgi:hypothetical protein
VVFDPKQITYVDLLGKWAPIEALAAGVKRAIYCTSDEQRRVAEEWKTHVPRGAAVAANIIVRAGDVNAFIPADR